MPRRLLPVLLITAGLAIFIYLEYRSYVNEVSHPHASVETKRNVYLITATGLRSDHLSSFMYQSIQTPAIDYLAYDGIRFTNSWTVSPESLPAHLSMLSGIYPFRDPVAPVLQRYYMKTTAGAVSTGFTMPEWFRRKGYATAAFLADPDLRVPDLMTGLFDTVAIGDRVLRSWQPSYTSEAVCRLASDWIERNSSQPQLVLLNLDEPTFPYNPPPPFNHHYQSFPYDGEIAALDEQIGLFMNRLKSSGLFEKSIIVFTAPYANNPENQTPAAPWKNDRLQIPLFIIAPGLLPRHNTYTSAATLVDVFPTILKLMDMQPAGLKLDGTALFEKGSNREINRDFLFGASFFQSIADITPALIVKNRNLKMVTGAPDLFFGDSDAPVEDSESLRNTAGAMKKALKELAPSISSLKSIGDPDAALVAEEAIDLARDGKLEDAWLALQNFKELPRTARMLSLETELAAATGRLDEAAALVQQSYQTVSAPEILQQKAEVMAQAFQYKEAQEMLSRSKKQLLLTSYYTHNMYASILAGAGDLAGAVEHYTKALAANPRLIDALRGRAAARLRMGNTGAASADLERAEELDPNDPEVCRELAQLRLQSDTPGDAAPLLRRLLELDGHDEQSRLALAQLLESGGNHSEAESLARQVLVSTEDPLLKDAARKIIAK